MLMQSYDFLELFKRYDCKMELGGDDQWSNILGGIDLVRRKENKQVYGMTFTLLTTSDGKKMGKTAKGALWLDPEKVSPYEFYQYWRNVDDVDVVRLMKMITFVPMEEIYEMEKWEGADLNKAKVRLAYEVTKLVHGEAEADKAKSMAEGIFGGGAGGEMPTTELDSADDETALLDIMLTAKLIPSKGEGRRLIQQGGVSVDDVKITEPNYMVKKEDLVKGIVIKKGKKVFHKVVIK